MAHFQLFNGFGGLTGNGNGDGNKMAENRRLETGPNFPLFYGFPFQPSRNLHHGFRSRFFYQKRAKTESKIRSAAFIVIMVRIDYDFQCHTGYRSMIHISISKSDSATAVKIKRL